MPPSHHMCKQKVATSCLFACQYFLSHVWKSSWNPLSRWWDLTIDSITQNSIGITFILGSQARMSTKVFKRNIAIFSTTNPSNNPFETGVTTGDSALEVLIMTTLVCVLYTLLCNRHCLHEPQRPSSRSEQWRSWLGCPVTPSRSSASSWRSTSCSLQWPWSSSPAKVCETGSSKTCRNHLLKFTHSISSASWTVVDSQRFLPTLL